MKFGIKFPVFDKIDVNGDTAHPLYNYLKSEAPGLLGSKSIKWNFTKFLVDKDGKVLKRFAPTDKPENIQKEIKKLLS
jgi:glutathione peroxidase